MGTYNQLIRSAIDWTARNSAFSLCLLVYVLLGGYDHHTFLFLLIQITSPHQRSGSHSLIIKVSQIISRV